MATNLPNTTNSTTRQFFNGYFDQSISINPDVYNQIFSFFSSKTASKAAAEQLTQSVMILTYNNKLDPLHVIRDFNKATSQSELKNLMVTFFNSFRGPTSKIGYSNDIVVNQWVQRNILA